jgi:acetyltransferase
MNLEYMLEQYPKKVTLKDGTPLTIRPLRADDVKAFHKFFVNVSETVRMLYKDRVVDIKVIRAWCRRIDYGRILPLLAWHGNKIVADATLHQKLGGWRRHIGRVRLAMHMEYRNKDLALIMMGELIDVARRAGLEKLQAELMGEHRLTRRALSELGFSELLVLPDYAKDLHANTHDYVLMGRHLVTEDDYTCAGD